MVRYAVSSDQVAENERLVRAVYEELDRINPPGIRYTTFKLDDGVTFVHIASLETDDRGNPLDDIVAFREFQRDLRARVTDGPAASELSEIGSYRLVAIP